MYKKYIHVYILRIYYSSKIQKKKKKNYKEIQNKYLVKNKAHTKMTVNTGKHNNKLLKKK